MLIVFIVDLCDKQVIFGGFNLDVCLLSGLAIAERCTICASADSAAMPSLLLDARMTRSVLERTRWSTPVFRTAVRFRSAPFSLRGCNGFDGA